MAWQWTTIIDTDAYAGDRGEYSTHDWSVTEAGHAEILAACNAVAEIPAGAECDVTRDFDGHAYVSVNGVETYTLESIETCGMCGDDLADGGDGYDDMCGACMDKSYAAMA